MSHHHSPYTEAGSAASEQGPSSSAVNVDSRVKSCVETSVEYEYGILDREIDLSEISRCIRKFKNNCGSDSLVGELLKYGGSQWLVYCSCCFLLLDVKRWCFHNGEKSSLLICLRKVIRRV